MLRCLSHAYKVDGAVRVGYLSLLFSDGTNEDLPRDRFARLYSGKLQRSTADVLEECDRKGAVWFDGPLVTGFQKISSGHVRLWFNGERSFVLFSLQEALKMLEHQDAASLIDREIMSTKELTIGSRGDVPDLSGGGALKLPLQSRRPLHPMGEGPPAGGYQVSSCCLQAAFFLLTGPYSAEARTHIMQLGSGVERPFVTQKEFHSFRNCKGLMHSLAKCAELTTRHLDWLLAQTSGKFVAQVKLWNGDTRHAVAFDIHSPPLLIETDPTFPHHFRLSSYGAVGTLKLIGIIDVVCLCRVVAKPAGKNAK